MLFLIGLGLDTDGISLHGLEIAKNSKELMLDRHTNFIPNEYIERLESLTAKKIRGLTRSDLEELVKDTIADAKSADVCIFVSGDPMVATTHHVIQDAALTLGIKVEIIHAGSILSAAMGESGLDVYRFGQITTITFWRENYKPTSFLDIIAKNMRNKEHTLALVDYDYLERRRMTLGEALKLLRTAEKEKELNIIKDETTIIAIGNMGKPDQKILITTISDLEKNAKQFDGKIVSLILPAEMNFAEKDATEKYRA